MKKFFKIPLIVTVHGPADFYEVPKVVYPLLRFILRRSSITVVVSPRLKYDLTKNLGTLQLKVICNGIPFPASAAPQNWVRPEKSRIGPGDFVILMAGRLVRRKRVDLIVRALPKLLEKIPKIKLLILGGGIERAKIVKLIEELQLEHSVDMPGWVSEEEKNTLFSRADVFMQLSEREGLSLALLESKAAGVPAIVVGSQGSWEPINPGTTGLLLEPPATVDKIVDRTVFLYRNPELRKKMGEMAQVEAQREYTLQKMVDDYIRIYNEARAKSRGLL
jgi:glycosyltransferase involved in cell wall biosynthesis